MTKPAKSELHLSAPAGGAVPIRDINGDVAHAAAGATAEQIEAKRAAVHAATHAEHAALAAAEAQDGEGEGGDEAATATREDVETVELKLPDGRMVLFGPPSGVATQLKVASLLGADLNPYTSHLMRSLLSVRQIDGKPVPAIGNRVDAHRVANMVGEDGVELLGVALNTYWPPVSIADLAVVKKNLRQR